MLFAVENNITQPINLGSGKGYSIKEVVDMVVKHSNKPLKVKWLTDKPAGDSIRLFDMTRAKSYGFDISVSLEEGIKQTAEEARDYTKEVKREVKTEMHHMEGQIENIEKRKI